MQGNKNYIEIANVTAINDELVLAKVTKIILQI